MTRRTHKCPVCGNLDVEAIIDLAVKKAVDGVMNAPMPGHGIGELPKRGISPVLEKWLKGAGVLEQWLKDTEPNTETHTGPGPSGGPYYATSPSKPATPTSSAPGATP